jgi:hypothetical protein
MQAWRRQRSGEKKKLVEQSEKRIDLTPTGLLMEGEYIRFRCFFAQVLWGVVCGCLSMSRRLLHPSGYRLSTESGTRATGKLGWDQLARTGELP